MSHAQEGRVERNGIWDGADGQNEVVERFDSEFSHF